jgi:hypothetical protein
MEILVHVTVWVGSQKGTVQVSMHLGTRVSNTYCVHVIFYSFNSVGYV